MADHSSSVSATQPMTLKEAAERRAALLRQRDHILERQAEERTRTIRVFAEAREYLPQPLRDYLLPVCADGFPADECLFRRADLSEASEAERDARFRYRLAHEAVEWHRGLAEAVRLLPPDRDEGNTYQSDHDFEVLMHVKDALAEIESLCMCEPASPGVPADRSCVCTPVSPAGSAVGDEAVVPV